MKMKKSELTVHEKAFQDSEKRPWRNGQSVKFWSMSVEQMAEKLGVSLEDPAIKTILTHYVEAYDEQIRHHACSDLWEHDHKVLGNEKATESEKKESASRMKNGYVFDLELPATKSGQLGKTRTSPKWGQWAKFVPTAKTMVDPALEEDSEEYREAIIEKAKMLKAFAESNRG